jgi:hypothetical protein
LPAMQSRNIPIAAFEAVACPLMFAERATAPSMQASRAAEERARKIREALAKKAAEESADAVDPDDD